MKLSEARKVLGLENAVAALTEEVIVTAYRRELLAVHPDTAPPAGLTGETRTVDELTTAKKTLLDSLSGDDSACKGCGGSGKVRAKFGVVRCISCRGTGDRQP